MTTGTDRIEKKILLRAPLARVWQAISDSAQFGSWFGMKLDGPFEAGRTMRATIAPTTVDPEIAAMQKPLAGLAFDIVVDRIEPQRLFSFRWHPHAIDPTLDVSAEPPTLVAFELEETAGGVLLTVTESGFDAIPLARRAKAFAANDQGWYLQTTMIEKYLARGA
jgi:uncharacterized protein YndB with AHSA1/START domain